MFHKRSLSKKSSPERSPNTDLGSFVFPPVSYSAAIHLSPLPETTRVYAKPKKRIFIARTKQQKPLIMKKVDCVPPEFKSLQAYMENIKIDEAEAHKIASNA